ncbi:MAG: RHS repeat-associated core domain-containing protein, partial [Candidatus Korobacteraceae bacterium]
GTMYFDQAYAPFGENYAGVGTVDRSFTGQNEDSVSNILDFPFRQYTSTQGRWMVPDPAGLAAVDITNPQTWNRYAYVANNPLSYIDPTGEFLGVPWTDFSGLQTLLCGGACGFRWFYPFLDGEGPHGGKGKPGKSKPTQPPTPKPTPTQPQPAAPCTGGGVAVVAGATGAVGVLGAGAATTGTVGAGAFESTSSGPSVGAVASGGGVAYAGNSTTGAPTQPTDLNDRSVSGAFGGAGVGIMVTNAGSAQALQSTTTTWSFDIAFEFGGSIQVSSGNGIWAVSVTLGPGLGLSFTEMNTATAATGGPCGGG